MNKMNDKYYMHCVELVKDELITISGGGVSEVTEAILTFIGRVWGKSVKADMENPNSSWYMQVNGH